MTDWPHWARALLVIAITVLLVILILMFLPDASGETMEPPPSKWDAEMLMLDREALNEAYREQLTRLFVVWLKDESGQPRRAINGARQARHAYIEVMKEIEKREQARPK